MNTALVIGAAGQDGTLLGYLLKSKGYRITGLSRGKACKCYDESLIMDVRDSAKLGRVVRECRPNEIYYLASYHRSSQGRAGALAEGEASLSFEVNLNAYIAVLETAVYLSPQPRVFYASSSLIYGGPDNEPITERTPPRPRCLYSISKVAAMEVSEQFRQQEGMHISVGILFNHESIFRKDGFLSKRIVDGIKAIQRGENSWLSVGNLSGQCDWGYAGDFVEAMWRMLQADYGDTYVVATGKLHTVRDWVEYCCALANLHSEKVIREDPAILSRQRPVLRGDHSKLHAVTGWKPATDFEDIVGKMFQGVV